MTFQTFLARATLVSGTLTLGACEIARADSIALDTLDLAKMSAGWQKPLAGKSVEGNALRMGGRTFERGIGTHADSQFAIDLFGTATRFSTLVGVDDETQGKGSVEFQIYVDGKLKAQSGPMRGGAAPKKLEVDLMGAKRLILAVLSGDDGDNFDHADWLEPVIETNANALLQPVAVAAASVFGVDDETPMPIFASSRPVAMPQIHGARVVGATPNRPFLFAIPATGEAPLRFSARGLPAGLRLDAKTGFISGAIARAGTSVAKLRVSNAKGEATRNLTFVAGAYQLAQTPPMGWNSWNIFYANVDEAKVRSATDWMIKTGLNQRGYNYINIDDGWQAPRLPDGTIGVNAKFGDMKRLGEYIHSKGLKFGTYTSPGTTTCAGYAGSYGFEAQDARSYASWGVDFLKHDWCSYSSVAASAEQQKVGALTRQKAPYVTMRAALDSVDRDIVYSLCQYGMADVWKWGDDFDVKGDLWRTTYDIRPSYASMTNIGFSQSDIAPFGGPGRWNDPDMLFMHALKPNEQITHLTLWSLLAAPLLIGSDLSKMSQFTLDALSNDEVIEIDQDPLGRGAVRRTQSEGMQVWSRPLWNGTTAVGLFNTGLTKRDLGVTWSELGLRPNQKVRDAWQRRELGAMREGFKAPVAAHGAVLIVVGTPTQTDYTPPRKG